MRIHVPSAACDVISFNGQGQLCPLTCADWRDLSNHTRMSTVQSSKPEKKAKNHVTSTWKLPWKSCSTTHLPFLSPNPKVLKAFLKSFPTKIKPTKCPAKEKKWGKKSEKRGEERKWKSRNFAFCVCPNFKSWYFAYILQLDRKAAKCTTWKRLCGKLLLLTARQWPENHSTSFKRRFSAKSPRANGLKGNKSDRRNSGHM